MRRAQLVEYVNERVQEHFDSDVASEVIECEAYESLCQALNEAAGGDADGIDSYLEDIAESLSDYDLDWIVGDTFNGESADRPAAFLLSRLRRFTG